MNSEHSGMSSQVSNKKNGAACHNSTTTSGKINRERLSQEYLWMMEYKRKFKDAKTYRGANSSLYSNLNMIDYHLKWCITGSKHNNNFKVGVLIEYSKCTICGIILHIMSNRYKSSGPTFFNNHNVSFFGFSCYDTKNHKTRKSGWSYPTQASNEK